MTSLRQRPRLTRPEAKDRFEIGARLVVWAYAAIILIAVLGQPIGQFDEALPLVDGRLVQQGQTPNVDFWSIYPPMFYYLTAAGFHLFGQTVLVHRCLKALLYVLSLLLTARFFSNKFPDFRRLVPGAVLLAAVGIGPNIALQVWPSYAISWLALLTYLLGWRGPVVAYRWKIALSGLLAGVALLLRVNFGLYVAAVVAGDLLLGLLPKGQADQARIPRGSTLSAATLFFTPFLLSNEIFYACVYGRNTSVVFAQSVLAAQKLTSTHRFIELSFSTGVTCALAAPLLWFSIRLLKSANRVAVKGLIPAALGCTLATLAFAIGAQPSIAQFVPALEIALLAGLCIFFERPGRPEICLLLFYACLLHYYLSRADESHMAPLLLASAMLVPFLLFSPSSESADRGQFISQGGAFVVIVAAICVLLSAAGLEPSAMDLVSGVKLLASGALFQGGSDGDRILDSAPGEPWAFLCDRPDELDAVRFVRSRTSRTDAIFVGVADHSRAFANDVRAYWLSDRPVGVRYPQFDPGIVTEAPAQAEMIADLDRRKVQYALIEHAEDAGDETFQKRGYAGSKLLDEYLAVHFREEARFGDFSVLRRVGP